MCIFEVAILLGCILLANYNKRSYALAPFHSAGRVLNSFLHGRQVSKELQPLHVLQISTDPSTMELETSLFGSPNTVFERGAEEIAMIEKLVKEVEDEWEGAQGISDFAHQMCGAWDCGFATIVEGTGFPEKADLAGLTFNRLLPNEKYRPYLQCLHMMQYVGKEADSLTGAYDNGIVVKIDGDESAQRWVILTKGTWTAENEKENPHRLLILFTDIIVRRLPLEMADSGYGAREVFEYLYHITATAAASISSTQETIYEEHCDFLNRIGISLPSTTASAGAGAGASTSASAIGGESLISGDENSDVGVPLSLPLHISQMNMGGDGDGTPTGGVYSDITYIDEGLRFMRGSRGGLYLLVKG